MSDYNDYRQSLRIIKSNRISKVSSELRRFDAALTEAFREHEKSDGYDSPSRKMSKAKRASLDLSAALVEFRKSFHDEYNKGVANGTIRSSSK